MTLPKVVEDEVGRILTITWLNEETFEPEELTGATLSGIIETQPGPDYDSREIEGPLAVLSADDGTLTWTLHASDTADPGFYLVQFIAQLGGGVIIRSLPEPWNVIRSLTAPS